MGTTVGRRDLVRGMVSLPIAGGALAGAPATAEPHRRTFVPSTPRTVSWGQLPNRDSRPVTTVDSGSVVVVDTVSHEGILEDQGKDPRAFFGGFGVRARDVLSDAVEIAARKAHDGPGPHVVTGPIAVRGALPGHVLKIETLRLELRVGYGVVSNRHGRGALPERFPQEWAGIPRLRRYFNAGGNISVFATVHHRHGQLVGQLHGNVSPRFPLAPFMGIMGVARDTGALVDSVPPTDAGGNLDINDLGVGSTLYLPVQVPGALFFTGDPHMAQGDGEVALTAMEGSLRGTFRLTAIPPGGHAPKVAFTYPFAETRRHWIPIGLSDPDGSAGGQQTSLDLAMKTAAGNALAFLTGDLGMDPPLAYAYLSAAADFQVSQVVDRTTGIHALIPKEALAR
jgi:acetamidase/formamidase